MLEVAHRWHADKAVYEKVKKNHVRSDISEVTTSDCKPWRRISRRQKLKPFPGNTSKPIYWQRVIVEESAQWCAALCFLES